MKEQYFSQKIEEIDKALQSKERSLRRLGTYRLFSFGAFIFCLTWGIREISIVGYLLALVGIIVFGKLVSSYGQLKKKLQYDKAMKSVLEKYKQRLSDGPEGWKEFNENGKAYLMEEDTVASDLDLLGRSSLYQYLSVCQTPIGKMKLAKALKDGCTSLDELKKRQGAVKELIEDEAFALKLQAIGVLMAEEESLHEKRDEEVKQFIANAKEKKSYVSKAMCLLSYVLPFITLFAVIVVLKDTLTGAQDRRVMAYIVSSIGIVLQLAIGIWGGRSNKTLLEPAYAFTKKISVYEAFFTAIEEKEFKSAYLKEMKEKLAENGGAVKGIKAIKGLSGAIEVCFNTILHGILVMLLMWDVHCKDALSRWQKQYGDHVEMWFEMIGEIELILSLATLGHIKENYCIPTITEEDRPKLSFKALAHPLIQESKVVSNSFKIEDDTCIITGSNMSGKTTFLRSIGVNLALAYAGGIVLAQQFTASRMKVLTSMRANDRIDQGISTFYAEILRIKEMVEYSKLEKTMLVLIDEIFKGTNSVDRIIGAEETIKKLGLPWVSVMVSTHDFELCHLQLQGARKMMNYHFEEYYEEDKILFDYRLKSGISQTKNAQYLLKMAGIM